jgi:FAD:protein FMN transferase
MASASIRRGRPLLGTFVEIAISGANPYDLEIAVESAFGTVTKVHRLMSFHDPASDVGRLNREADEHAVAVDPWTYEVIATAIDLNRRSDGAFDIAVAPVLQELGLLPTVDRRAGAAARSGISGTIELVAGQRIRFHQPGTRIDLGGIAKGFAVDRAVAALRAHGVTSGLVNAGGDLSAFGPAAHVVHLRDPADPGRSLGPIAIADEALASSGGRLDPVTSSAAMAPSVIDPTTRVPVRAIQGATVRAPTCMVADALTKVVMIAGEAADTLLDYFQASALLVTADGDRRITRSWQETSRAA